jgi:four helix bundle protein
MLPFRRLSVWEKAHTLALRVHRVVESGALQRSPGLGAQLLRSVTAIPTNIAEGSGHSTQAQFNRFLEIALASASEADYQLLLAKDLDLIPAREYAQLEARIAEVRAMLSSLRKRVLQRVAEEKVSGKRATKRSAGDS